MTARRLSAAWCAAGLLVAISCGKRGDPLAPLRPIPGRVTEMTAARVGDRVELRLTIPAANIDGTSPAAVDRIEIYRVGTAAGAVAPTGDAIAGDPRNLRLQIPVKREVDAGGPPSAAAPTARGTPAPAVAPASAPDARPMAGDATLMVDRLDEAATAGGITALHYVAKGVTGGGRGRAGPLSAVLSVPLGVLPPDPQGLALSHDETTLTLTWKPGAEGQAFRVFAGGAGVPFAATPGATGAPSTSATGVPLGPELLTAQPLTSAEFKMPVEFGRERCFLVRAVQVSGSVMVDGALVGPVCATPLDTFAPPPPSGLRATQEGAAITLFWTAAEAADLAGYRVLRGEGAEGILRQLTTEPVTTPSYSDTTARPGTAYTYSVVSVDKAGNLSTQSNRQTVTVR